MSRPITKIKLIMITLFKSVCGKKGTAHNLTVQDETGFKFYGHLISKNEYMPDYIAILNVTNPNCTFITRTVSRTGEANLAHDMFYVKAEHGDVLKINTDLEYHVVYVYQGNLVDLFSGLQDWPTQEVIDQQISLVPREIGFLLVQKYVTEIFKDWPKDDSYLDDISKIVHKQMKQDNLVFNLFNVKETLSKCVRDAFEKIKTHTS